MANTSGVIGTRNLKSGSESTLFFLNPNPESYLQNLNPNPNPAQKPMNMDSNLNPNPDLDLHITDSSHHMLREEGGVLDMKIAIRLYEMSHSDL